MGTSSPRPGETIDRDAPEPLLTMCQAVNDPDLRRRGISNHAHP